MKFTRKKLTVRPQEALTKRKQMLFDNCVEVISNTNQMTLHCFDEAGAVRTNGNRKYGQALISCRQWNYNDMHQMQHSLLLY